MSAPSWLGSRALRLRPGPWNRARARLVSQARKPRSRAPSSLNALDPALAKVKATVGTHGCIEMLIGLAAIAARQKGTTPSESELSLQQRVGELLVGGQDGVEQLLGPL